MAQAIIVKAQDVTRPAGMLDSMQLESLQVFCDIVRWASFSRGAAANQMSQSSASQAVQRIEEHLGVKLIDRSRRPFVLTPQGKLFYEGCKELVGRYAEIESRVRGFHDADHLVGTVRVASIYSVGLAHLSRLVQTFEQAHPEVNVRLEFLHPTRVVEAVSQGLAEIGLISCPRKWPDLKVIPWRDEPIVLVVPPNHPWAAADGLDVGQLDGATLVRFDADLPIRRAIDRYLRRHDVRVRVGLEFDNIETIKRAVEAEAGVALLPEPTIVQEVRAGTLAAVPLRGPGDPLIRPLALIHRRGVPLDRTARRLLEWIQGDPVAPEVRCREATT